MTKIDPFRIFYQSFTGKGALPLEPDDPYYVPILESNPEKDPILALWQRIDLAESESVNLLTGFRGNGKSTELRRLKSYLEKKSDCQVFLVNMLDYVLMTKPVELSDFILSLMAALAGAVEKSDALDLAPLSQSYWKRLQVFLSSEVKFDKLDLDLRTPGIGGQLGLKLKTDPQFKTLIQKHLEGHLTRLVEDAGAFVDELTEKIREQTKDPDKKVVLLVDSLEQLRGVGEDADLIYASVVELFSGQAANLQFPKLHVVYTVPPYLNALAHNLGRSLGGHPITQWPNIHIRSAENKLDEDGLSVLKNIVEKRYPQWQKILPDAFLTELARSSGGDLRDFFRLIRECLISLRTTRLSRPEAAMDDDMVNRVIRQLRNELLPISDEDAQWLARIHTTKKEGLRTDKDLPALARFLDSNLIMNYLNGEPWYDVHPLLIDEIMDRRKKEPDQTQ